MKRLLIVLVILLLLMGIGAGGAWFFFAPQIRQSLGGVKLFGFVLVPASKTAPAPPPEPSFVPSIANSPSPIPKELIYHLPQLIGTTFSTDGRPHLLRIHVALVMHDAGDNETIGYYLPRVRDVIETYLHDDLVFDRTHPISIDTLRRDLLPRINAVIAPAKLTEILVDDLAIQT